MSAGSKGGWKRGGGGFQGLGTGFIWVGGELRHSWNCEGRDACQQRGEALAPAPAQTQAQKLPAAVGAADGADDQQPGAQRHQPRRLILSNLAFEVGDEVEQETNQAEGGFGAIEGVQAEAVSAKVLLEFLDV